MEEISELFEAATRVVGALNRIPDMDGLGADDASRTVVVLEWLADKLKSRTALLKGELASLSKTPVGSDYGERGSRLLETNTCRVVVQNRVGTHPSEKDLKELMRDRNIPLAEAFDEKKAQVLNPSKLDRLISIGKLTQKEVDGLKSKSTVVAVSKKKAQNE